MPKKVIKWVVTAQAINPRTGDPMAVPRDEEIDDSNVLFKHCTTLQDVHKAYEHFWNGINDQQNEREIVLVQKIKPC